MRDHKRKGRWHNFASQRPKETSYVHLYDIIDREAKRKEANGGEVSRQDTLFENVPIEESPTGIEGVREDGLQEREEEDLDNE